MTRRANSFRALTNRYPKKYGFFTIRDYWLGADGSFRRSRDLERSDMLPGILELPQSFCLQQRAILRAGHGQWRLSAIGCTAAASNGDTAKAVSANQPMARDST